MNQRSGGEQAIGDGQRIRNPQMAPTIGDFLANGQETIAHRGTQHRQPTLQARCRDGVTSTQQLRFPADLAQDDHGNVDIGGRNARVSSLHARVAALTLAQFGQDIGVNQESHAISPRP